MKLILNWTLIPALIVLVSSPAFAYVGPGAGLSLLGALWGLLIAVLTALAFIAIWPIRRYRKKLRERRQQAEPQEASQNSDADPSADRTEIHTQESQAKRQAR